MSDDLQKAVLDKLTKTCTCRVVSRLAIKEAIAAGADTVEAVMEKTGAGKGSCKGQRCKWKIEELIKANQ